MKTTSPVELARIPYGNPLPPAALEAWGKDELELTCPGHEEAVSEWFGVFEPTSEGTALFTPGEPINPHDAEAMAWCREQQAQLDAALNGLKPHGLWWVRVSRE